MAEVLPLTHPSKIDPVLWVSGGYKGRPLPDILRAHDISALFGFLAARGWSRTAIGMVTGLDPNRVREIARRKRRVTSYEVLARIADGLGIERGLMGLAFTDPARSASPGTLPALHGDPQ